MIRRARTEDVDATARIYEALMDREEAGQGATNWKRGVYPTRETARRAQEAGWLYVKEDGAGGICASMILNHEQPPCYRDADWQVAAAPENVPPALLAQLDIGGILVIPTGKQGQSQVLQTITRDDADKYSTTQHEPVLFVPLISGH